MKFQLFQQSVMYACGSCLSCLFITSPGNCRWDSVFVAYVCLFWRFVVGKQLRWQLSLCNFMSRSTMFLWFSEKVLDDLGQNSRYLAKDWCGSTKEFGCLLARLEENGFICHRETLTADWQQSPVHSWLLLILSRNSKPTTKLHH